jgi:hypothetical protein
MQRPHLFIVDDEMWFALTPALSPKERERGQRHGWRDVSFRV